MRSDDGQLMIVSGIILVLAFAATALTLTQVADLEKQVSGESSSHLLAEYRYLRSLIGETLWTSTTPSMTEADFKTVFGSAQIRMKSLAHTRGYDLALQLADGSRPDVPRDEWDFTEAGFPDRETPVVPAPAPGSVATDYLLRSYDNSLNWEPFAGGSTVAYDGTNNGILWVTSGCAIGGGACVQGVIVYFYLADETTSISETIVYGLNI